MLNDIELKPLLAGFEPREVQKLSIPLIRDEFKKGNKKVVLHLATSGGKTVLAGLLFREVFKKTPGGQCWFIAPRVTLLEQTRAEFEKWFGYDCGIVQGDAEIDLSKHVQIATIQTLHNRLNSDHAYTYRAFRELPVKMVAGDEVHLMFKGYESVQEAWAPHMVGLTATPFTKGMGLFWESMVRPKHMIELLESGEIADYRVKACVPINRANLTRNSTGEYKESDIERETGAIIGDVFQQWKDSEDAKGRPFLGFANSISTCIALSELFNDNGANTRFVHSKMAHDDVQAVLDAFKAGHYDGVWSVVKLIEGFDFPEASMMIDCAPLAPSKYDPNIPNSPARYVQKLGRVIRKHTDKEYALVHDHTMNFLQFGPVELIEDLFPELDKSKKGEAKELTTEQRKARVMKECSVCGMEFTGKVCQICGNEPKMPTQFLEAGDLEFVDGEMIEVKKTTKKKNKKEFTKEEKLLFAGQLKRHCLDIQARKPDAKIRGIYWYKFKARFKEDPYGDFKFDKVRMQTLTPGFESWIRSQNIRYAKGKANASGK